MTQLTTSHRPRAVRRGATAAFMSLCLTGLSISPTFANEVPTASLPVTDAYRSSADIGFHDYTRDGSQRAIRNDLTGSLNGMVEFTQASTSNPTGNSALELPTTVANRTTLLMFTPTSTVSSVKVKVEAKGKVFGTLDLDHPNLLPASDQNYDSRGTVAYSLRAWSIELPATWVQPGLKLTFTAGSGDSGVIDTIDIAAPTELVINNIELGMLTGAPQSGSHRFINDPANGATDYFQTIPISKLTMAQYEDVELDKVIVASGAIYDKENLDPSTGGVYSGTMRENVGKAQVSTGINLATWGITSSSMNQVQPGNTNQRVIHHSAGRYLKEGVVTHGLSGGNGMATLWSSVGNELSHELGHSYGLGHYPGRNGNATGDDIIRNASHNMDSGWGYISYRKLMRSNLSGGGYQSPVSINGDKFYENLAGKYNFNTDTMAGGWDASPVSDYTHMTGYSLKRTQNSLRTLVADTSYPSGYRNWDTSQGEWVDAKELNANFNLLKPKKVGTSVFTILGGYNPANPDQTLVYPAFRSNYGVTFDLPQVDPDIESETRACWLEVGFKQADTQYIKIDAGNGVKQLNVNIAESEKPTSAQVKCRVNGETTALGNQIEIATDLEPMAAPVIVGQEYGNEALRAQELAALEPKLEALSEKESPILDSGDMLILRGWSDDLSKLSYVARKVANKILGMSQDAENLAAYISENPTDKETVREFLTDSGYVESDGSFLPEGTAVTVDRGACLYLSMSDSDVLSVHVDGNRASCGEAHDDKWFTDLAGRIHSSQYPQYCLVSGSPVSLGYCSTTNANQQWVFKDNGQVVRSANVNQALDFFVHQGYPGIYGSTGNSNQIWSGFSRSANALVAQLDSSGIQQLWTTLTAPDVAESVSPPAGSESSPGSSEGGSLGSPGGATSPGSGPSSTPDDDSTAPGTGSGSGNSSESGGSATPEPSTGSSSDGGSDFSPTDQGLPNHVNEDASSDEDNVDNENPHAGTASGTEEEDHSGHDHSDGSEDGSAHGDGTKAATEKSGGSGTEAVSVNGDSQADNTASKNSLPVTGTSLVALVIALGALASGISFLLIRRRNA